MKRVMEVCVVALLVGVAYGGLGSMMAMTGLEAVMLLALLIAVAVGAVVGRRRWRGRSMAVPH